MNTDESESLEIAAGFILKGLQTGEKVCIAAAEAKARLIMNVLEDRTPRLERFSASGNLHLSQGLDSPKRQVQYLQALAACPDERFTVFADVGWIFKKGWSNENPAQLEKSMLEPRHAGRCIFLYQYALDRFKGGEIMTVLETHTDSITRGRVVDNSYGGLLVTASAAVF